MMLGKRVRLNRIFSAPSGRVVTVAIDHPIAFSYDINPHLNRIHDLLPRIVEGPPDAITMMKGVAEHCWEPFAGRVPLIVQTTCFTPGIPNRDHQLAFVEDALRLGADAIAMTITVGTENQGDGVAMLGQLVRDAAPVGLPVVAHIYPKGELVPEGARYTARWSRYAARVGAEVGVDLVKTDYTGSAESFREVVDACPVPVVAAGGQRLESFRDVLEMARGVVQAGGAGLTLGRNVWASGDVPGAIRALKAVVHEGASVDDALGLCPEA
ncbi:class I fructose-bisphosphate aldolase [Planctomycetota bacterium]